LVSGVETGKQLFTPDSLESINILLEVKKNDTNRSFKRNSKNAADSKTAKSCLN